MVTPGDAPTVLVAMNPAALKANLHDLPRGGTVIVDTDEFTKRNLAKVGYAVSPVDDGSLSDYQVHAVKLTSLTVEAVAKVGLSRKDAERSKNMFALGLLSWLYHRPLEGTRRFLETKFGGKREILRANLVALEAGWSYGETTEGFAVHYEVKPAVLPPGRYRTIRGNQALAYGLVAAAERSGLPLFLGSYPITPASDILHELSALKHFGVRTFQAEDEIAGVAAALGASYGGSLGVTTTSGPGRRAQGRDHRAGRHPGAAADHRRRAARRTVHRAAHQDRAGRPAAGDVRPQRRGAGPGDRRPVGVRLLHDGAGGGPDRDHLPHPGVPAVRRVPGQRLRAVADPERRLAAGPAGGVRHRTNHVVPTKDGEPAKADFWPYLRDPVTLARPWAIPGTPGLEHRIGGIEKKDGSGDISYDPTNHDHMVRTRAAKIAGIEVPPLEVDDPTGDAEMLVLGWGSTFGPITGAVRKLRADGVKVAQAHLRYLNPMPANTEEVLRSYRQVVLPEMNLGPAGAAAPRDVPGRRRSASTRSAVCRSGSTNWSAPSAACIDGTAVRTAIGTAGRMGIVHGVPTIEVGDPDEPAAVPGPDRPSPA